MKTLVAATGKHVVRLQPDGDGLCGELLLEHVHSTSLAVDERANTVYAGMRGEGVWAGRERGTQWERLRFPYPDVFSVAVSPVDSAVYAGCEPSMLFRSEDHGDTWRELAALRDLPSKPSWSFPPRPWTSHVRAIAPSPHDGSVLLVGIELGGLMYSTDGGASWRDHRPGAQRDVHAVLWHPTRPNRAYEAGGGGAAWSMDGGCTWQPADAGRGDRNYTWAVAVDPDDPDCWFLSAATGPGKAHTDGNADAALFRWRDGGPWQRLAAGLPESFASMPYCLLFVEGVLYAGLRNGTLYASDDRGDTWREMSVRGMRPECFIALVALGT